MKKSLVFISFAFIFLLSISIVSAGFWDWLNGDVTSKAYSSGGAGFAQRVASDPNVKCPDDGPKYCDGNKVIASKTSSTTGTRTSLAAGSLKSGAAGECPTGWRSVKAADEKIKTCCVQKSSSKSLFS